MKPFDGFRPWRVVTIGAVGSLVLEFWVGFGLAFSPGWANGWPNGRPMDAVWAGGMAALAGLTALTIVVGVAAAIAGWADRRGVARGWIAIGFVIAAALGMAAAGALGTATFERARVEARAMWPNGYGVR